MSPDARSGWDIYTIRVDGTDLQRVTTSHLDEELPDWSPDGSRIAYEAGQNGRNLYTVQPDGSNSVQLTHFNNTVLGAPNWSPDGTRIAFNSTLHQVEQARSDFGQFEIYVMNADGSDPKRLTHLATPDRALRYPSWSLDGRRIVFASDEVLETALAFGRRIFTIQPDGSNLDEIERGQFARYPRYAPVQ